MNSQQQLAELKAEIAAIQHEITTAKKKVEKAEEKLEKAIAEGKPADIRADLKALLESASAELTNLRKKEEKLMEKEIQLTRSLTNNETSLLPEKISKNEFLTFKLPPIVYYERPSKKSATSRANPRIPKSVSLWTDFTTNASQFVFEGDRSNVGTFVSRPAFTNYEEPIMSEKGVDAAVMTNIANVLSKFLREIGSDLLFTSSQMPEFKGEPDQIIYKRLMQDDFQKNIPYSFIEDKTIWDLPTPSSGETLVQWWIADVLYETNEGTKRPGKSIFHEITQVYGYMSANRLRYGVLTTYETTWFICRPQVGTLLISDPFDHSSYDPTLIRGFCYFLSLLEENHITEHSPDSTPASPRKQDITLPTFHSYNTRTRGLNTLPDDFQISCLRDEIGGGKCGYVYRWNHNGSDVAVKICDASNHAGYIMMQNELKAYEILKDLQGQCIPKLLFSGKLDNFIIIGMSFIQGSHQEPTSVQPQLSEILKLLEQHGVHHGDIKRENVLRGKDGRVWLIDFGLSEFILK
jgi:hypothetical protein